MGAAFIPVHKKTDRNKVKESFLKRRIAMYDKSELCNKIHEIYPEIGQCDLNLKVAWDDKRNVWEVNFEKDGNRITHYLEDEDAAPCMAGKQCIGLGIEFGQFL
jgi:hypothetical protein